MSIKWNLFIAFLLLVSLTKAQVRLPQFEDCPKENISFESLMTNWHYRNDTANYCYLKNIHDGQLNAAAYSQLRDTLLRSYQMHYDSADYIPAINYAAYGAALALNFQDTITYLQQLHDMAFTHYRIGNFVDCNIAVQDGLRISRQCKLDYYQAKFLLREARVLKSFLVPQEAYDRMDVYKSIIDTLPYNPENWYYYYNNLSILNHSDNDLAIARINGDSAIYYAKLTENEKLIGLSLSWRGLFHPIDTKEDQKIRLNYYEQSLAINRRMNDKEQLASNYELIANHYYLTKQWEKSLEYWLISYNYISKMADKNRERLLYLGMYRTYDSLGLIDNAYEYKLKESKVYEELFGVSTTVNIIELQNRVQKSESQNKIKELQFEQRLSTLQSNRQKNNFLIIILLLTIIFGTLFFILSRRRQNQKVQALLNEKETTKKIQELEKTALRTQMNPHFIFNCLNSIKSYIIKNEPRIAARYLTKFAQLMRLILRNSQHQLIPISEELKALKLYVELEQFRLSNKFIAKFEIDPSLNLDQLMMPPLILQPYVENAILHGLSNKEGEKILKIQFINDEEQLLIQVNDNGIGRAAAEKLRKNITTDKKSLGLKITKERLHFNNPNANLKNVNIVDQYTGNGETNGTSVVLTLPYKYKNKNLKAI